MNSVKVKLEGETNFKSFQLQSNFDEFLKYVSTLYEKDLSSYVITYKDKDGDMCSISTEEEFKQAIGDNSLRFLIQPLSGSEKSPFGKIEGKRSKGPKIIKWDMKDNSSILIYDGVEIFSLPLDECFADQSPVSHIEAINPITHSVYSPLIKARDLFKNPSEVCLLSWGIDYYTAGHRNQVEKLNMIKETIRSQYNDVRKALITTKPADVVIKPFSAVTISAIAQISRVAISSSASALAADIAAAAAVATTEGLVHSTIGLTAGAAGFALVATGQICYYGYQYAIGKISGTLFFKNVATSLTSAALGFAATVGGATLGGIIGTAIFPGIGTIIGACLGGFITGGVASLLTNFALSSMLSIAEHEERDLSDYEQKKAYLEALKIYNATEKTSLKQINEEKKKQMLLFHPDKNMGGLLTEEQQRCNVDTFLKYVSAWEMIKNYRIVNNIKH